MTYTEIEQRLSTVSIMIVMNIDILEDYEHILVSAYIYILNYTAYLLHINSLKASYRNFTYINIMLLCKIQGKSTYILLFKKYRPETKIKVFMKAPYHY